MQKIHWWQRKYIYLLDCSPFTEHCVISMNKKIQREDNIEQLQSHLKSLNYIADLYSSIQKWLAQAPKNNKDLTIYCLSDEGILRAVAVANILEGFLKSYGYSVDVFHSRLALLRVEKK